MMIYPAQILKIDNNKYEMRFPDLPGCAAKEYAIEALMKSAKNVIADHLSILAEYGEAIPNGSCIDKLITANDDEIYTWTLVEIDILPFLGKSHKINVTLPELLIKRIDDRVNKSESHKTRSGFIANACIQLLNVDE